MALNAKEYVLGTGTDELERLKIQHNVWADDTIKTWHRAGIRSDSTVLDLGCGPGYTTFDMTKIVGSNGRIIALDESKNFIDFVNREANVRNLKQLEALHGDAQNLVESLQTQKPELIGKFDFVYIRWVLCWLAAPEKTINQVYKILKADGKVIIHDYFNWRVMNMAPRSEALDRVVKAAIHSFELRKGNVDIAGELPRILRTQNFSLDHFELHQKISIGGGQDSSLAWLLTWWRTYTPKLLDLNLIDQMTCDKALSDLNELERNPDMFFFCPPLFEFIASKN